MRLRLTDFQSNTREGVEGTCKRCMRTVMLNYPTYTFADSGGGIHVVEGWYSDWGDHIVIDVNLPVFTHWLHSVEFNRPKEVAELSDIDGLLRHRAGTQQKPRLGAPGQSVHELADKPEQQPDTGNRGAPYAKLRVVHLLLAPANERGTTGRGS